MSDEFESEAEAERGSRVADAGAHVHHWLPKAAGRTAQGEPRRVLACDCGLTHREWLLQAEGKMGGRNG